MAIITRAALKAQFRSRAVPEAQDFYNLIDSTLVKKDDVFFGKWQPGISYRLDDVVIYKNALYCCITKGDDPCGCDEKGEPLPAGELKPSGSFCSDTPPDVDKKNWELLKLEITDNDWTIVESTTPGMEDIMFANVFGRIGMGTEDPSAKVHIHIKETDADFLFSPTGCTEPEFKIVKTGDPGKSLSIRIADEKTNFETDTEGFLFRPVQAPVDPNQEPQQENTVPEKNAAVMIKTVNSKPAIGVGTMEPAAALSLQDQPGKSLLLNPWNRNFPELFMSYRAKASMTCLSIAPTEKQVQLTTNATEGYVFRTGLDKCDMDAQGSDDQNLESLMSVRCDKDQKGKIKGIVGIGTENPQAHLEVTDAVSGSFLLSLKRANPALAVLNLQPDSNMKNYLTIGADNDNGVFVTDAALGFIFKKGDEYGTQDDSEVNIDRGEPLMRITPNGRVGIGNGAEPDQFNIDVTGISRMYNLYIYTDKSKVKDVMDIPSVLNRVRKLRPVSFSWKQSCTSNPKEQKQYGLQPHEVQETFPELVIKSDKIDTGAIAYPNLIAILTRAIQEQQEQLDQLTKKVNDLLNNRSKG